MRVPRARWQIAFYWLTVVMEVVYEPTAEKMRERAMGLVARLGLGALVVIGSFTVSGFFNGVAGSALTAKLRQQGISALMRQEMGYFDIETNS